MFWTLKKIWSQNAYYLLFLVVFGENVWVTLIYKHFNVFLKGKFFKHYIKINKE